jgi:hypothetical protein
VNQEDSIAFRAKQIHHGWGREPDVNSHGGGPDDYAWGRAEIAAELRAQTADAAADDAGAYDHDAWGWA